MKPTGKKPPLNLRSCVFVQKYCPRCASVFMTQFVNPLHSVILATPMVKPIPIITFSSLLAVDLSTPHTMSDIIHQVICTKYCHDFVIRATTMSSKLLSTKATFYVKNAPNPKSAGAPPQTPLGELTAFPKAPSLI